MTRLDESPREIGRGAAAETARTWLNPSRRPPNPSTPFRPSSPPRRWARWASSPCSRSPPSSPPRETRIVRAQGVHLRRLASPIEPPPPRNRGGGAGVDRRVVPHGRRGEDVQARVKHRSLAYEGPHDGDRRPDDHHRDGYRCRCRGARRRFAPIATRCFTTRHHKSIEIVDGVKLDKKILNVVRDFEANVTVIDIPSSEGSAGGDRAWRDHCAGERKDVRLVTPSATSSSTPRCTRSGRGPRRQRRGSSRSSSSTFKARRHAERRGGEERREEKKTGGSPAVSSRHHYDTTLYVTITVSVSTDARGSNSTSSPRAAFKLNQPFPRLHADER